MKATKRRGCVCCLCLVQVFSQYKGLIGDVKHAYCSLLFAGWGGQFLSHTGCHTSLFPPPHHSQTPFSPLPLTSTPHARTETHTQLLVLIWKQAPLIHRSPLLLLCDLCLHTRTHTQHAAPMITFMETHAPPLQ